ncbi:Nif3-like dinuclear metal center hexameric protein [Verrucomicrobiales bacterium]|nr:Nif3-like dinuclear metal center hexameric protein [Verrucomicrobiales bacterium]MDC0292149.1 Nif3-like dinuclear metal center hexameric protein [Verrucomicrobiales bacterium]
MAEINTLIDTANAELKISEIPDYPPALNGLQLTNKSGRATKIVAAVDACLPVIREAVEQEADLLIVHHGMFWNGAQRIVDAQFKKLQLAMENNLAIYSVHIPLDVHPRLGNNAQLISGLDLGVEPQPFFDWKGIKLGLRIDGLEISRADLLSKVKSATGAEAMMCAGGPETVSSLGVITGGAGAEIFSIAETGIDTFITGEGPHWSYTAAEELGLNLIYGGHYATETFGVKALSKWLCQKFEGLHWTFVDHPSGL